MRESPRTTSEFVLFGGWRKAPSPWRIWERTRALIWPTQSNQTRRGEGQHQFELKSELSLLFLKLAVRDVPLRYNRQNRGQDHHSETVLDTLDHSDNTV